MVAYQSQTVMFSQMRQCAAQSKADAQALTTDAMCDTVYVSCHTMLTRGWMNTGSEQDTA